jgi:hypothetical protein
MITPGATTFRAEIKTGNVARVLQLNKSFLRPHAKVVQKILCWSPVHQIKNLNQQCEWKIICFANKKAPIKGLSYLS